jgi:hypothetical protein
VRLGGLRRVQVARRSDRLRQRASFARWPSMAGHQWQTGSMSPSPIARPGGEARAAPSRRARPADKSALQRMCTGSQRSRPLARMCLITNTHPLAISRPHTLHNSTLITPDHCTAVWTFCPVVHAKTDRFLSNRSVLRSLTPKAEAPAPCRLSDRSSS